MAANADVYDKQVALPTDPAAAFEFQENLLARLEQVGYSKEALHGVRLSLEEALINAIKHGNQMDKAKRVHVRYCINERSFDIEIRDEGPGFDPEDVPDPTAPENLERPCGRGLLLIRGFMTSVEYVGRGNVVTMSKVRD